MAEAGNLIVNDAQKFAEDIVTYAMQRRYPKWVPSESYRASAVFRHYRRKLFEFYEKFRLSLKYEWYQYFNGIEKSIENYEKFCSVVKSVVSNMNFSMGKLLVFVMKLSEFATLLFEIGKTEAPKTAIMHIGEMLQEFPDFFEADLSEKECWEDFYYIPTVEQ